MTAGPLSVDTALRDGSRLPPLSVQSRTERREVWTLIGVGAASALLTTFVDLDLRIPGNHILFVVFPMALGFALVPRRQAGTIMGGSAVATATALGLAGVHLPGPGALTSLVLTGPMLDLALRWSRPGWRLYAGFVLAGALTNIGAFLARGGFKYFGLGGLGGGRRFAEWLPVATWTYALAGMLAGLLSAAAWFHLRTRADRG
jgi:hypothetical protein